MRRAIALAVAGVDAGAGGPFGAVVTRDGKLVAEGHNKVLVDRDPTAHAEIVAIRRASTALGTHDLSGCVLYASCDPCPMCLGAALWARVDRLVVAATDEDAAAIGFDDARFHAAAAARGAGHLPITRVLRDEAAAAMRRFDERPDLDIY